MRTPLRKRILTPMQMKSMLALGLLSRKGKIQAKKALVGRYETTRRRR